MINIIKQCYSECPRTQELHQDFAGFNLDECVQDILNKFEELPSDYNFIEFRENEELIGYYATTIFEGHDFLYTFFVRPKFRNSEYLTKFWNNIKKEFKGEFAAGVYNSNEPAKRFLRRNCKSEHNIENGSFFKF